MASAWSRQELDRLRKRFEELGLKTEAAQGDAPVNADSPAVAALLAELEKATPAEAEALLARADELLRASQDATVRQALEAGLRAFFTAKAIKVAAGAAPAEAEADEEK